MAAARYTAGMKLHVISFATLIAMTCGAPALSQPASPPTPPLYQVEIIVFAHREFDAGEERFAQNLTPLRSDHNESLLEVPLYVEPSPPLPTDSTGNTVPEAAPVDDPFAFRVLAPEQLQLNAQYRKLTNGSAYRTVLHAGWCSRAYPKIAPSRSISLCLA